VAHWSRNCNEAVVKVEERESNFGLVPKVTVKADEGYIVWVTMPSGMTADGGYKVAFKATLTASDNNPKFAFGKRPMAVAIPTQAQVTA
jgi:hypothetical protein